MSKKNIVISMVPYTLDGSAPTQNATLIDDVTPLRVIMRNPVPPIGAMGCVYPDPTQPDGYSVREVREGDRFSIDADGGHRALSPDFPDTDDGSRFSLSAEANLLVTTAWGFTYAILFEGRQEVKDPVTAAHATRLEGR